MAKKKKSKKAKIRLFFLLVLFVSVIGYLGYNLFSNVDKIMNIKKEESKLDSKLANLKDEEGIRTVSEVLDEIMAVKNEEIVINDGKVIISVPVSSKEADMKKTTVGL